MFHAFVLHCLLSAHNVTIFYQLLSAFPFNLRKAGENDFSKNNLSAILDIDTLGRILDLHTIQGVICSIFHTITIDGLDGGRT